MNWLSDSSSDSSGSESYQHIDEWNPGSFEHAERIPTTMSMLEEMASVSVAIALWNRATNAIPGIIENHNEWNTLVKSEVPRWIDVLPVPKSLTSPIQHHFNYVSSDVERWISYISREIFLPRVSGRLPLSERFDLYEHIDYIIWHPNGAINSAETARNLLKSDKLTIEEKFRFACTYCLREEIQSMWRTLQNTNPIVDRYNFSVYPLIFYWNCYCANRLDQIQALTNCPIDELMIRHRYVNNWPAIEYFFDRLNAEQQVTHTVSLIDKYGLCFQKLLLVKLNKSQRERVILDRIVQIMGNFTSDENIDDNTNDLIISTWYDGVFITQQQYVELFHVLLENCAEDHVLTEIWRTSRRDLKQHILNSTDRVFIKEVFYWCRSKLEKTPTFLSRVFEDLFKEDVKREITKEPFFKTWCKFFIQANCSELLGYLIELCFVSAEEATKFKLLLTKNWNFSSHCKTLLVDHNTQELANLLNVVVTETGPSSVLVKHLKILDPLILTYYSTGNLNSVTDFFAPLTSSYPEIITDYKSKLLDSRAGIKVCVNLFDSRNDVLVEIIADAFPADSAAEFKKKIIFSREGINKLRSMIVDGLSSNAEKWARLFLKSDKDRHLLRTILIQQLKIGNHTPIKTKRKFYEL